MLPPVSTVPLFRLLIPFCFGIVFSDYFVANEFITTALSLVALGIALLFGLMRLHPSLRWVWGILAFVLLLLLGALTTKSRAEPPSTIPSYTENYPTERCWQGEILSAAKPAGKYDKVRIQLESWVMEKGEQQPARDYLLVYLERDSTLNNLTIGTKVLACSRLVQPEPAKNPQAFDYRRYLSSQGIYYQSFVKRGQWKVVAEGKQPHLTLSARTRKQLLGLLKNAVPHLEGYGIAAGFLIGEVEGLSDELVTAFANTGAVHALSVSGMHVGILATALGFLMGIWIDERPFAKRTKTLLSLLLIWGFAFVCGLSSPVIRAALMFSFIVVGRAFYQRVSIFNIIAASAWVTLLIRPSWLYDVGFQLSYLAVLGIIAWQPRLAALYRPRWRLPRLLWEGTAVSIAAQAATAPLMLYYFHQFPLYFWLSNFVVMLTSLVIMYSGLLLFLLHSVPIVGQALSYCLGISAQLTATAIKQINRLPGAVWEGWWLNTWEVGAWYGALLWLYWAIERRKGRGIALSLLMLVGLIGFHEISRFQRRNTEELVVFHVYKHTLIGGVRGGKAFLVSDSTPISEKTLRYATKNYFSYHSRTKPQRFRLFETSSPGDFLQQSKPLLAWGKWIIAVVAENWSLAAEGEKLSVDAVVLSQSPRCELAELQQLFSTPIWIIDGSNKTYRTEAWKEECRELGLPCWFTAESGAYQHKAGANPQSTR